MLLCGCGNDLTIELDGNTYDLMDSPQEIIAQMDKNDVWLIDMERLDTYGKKGVVSDELAHKLNVDTPKEEVIVRLRTKRFDEIPEFEENSIAAYINKSVEIRVVYGKKGEHHDFSMGDEITDKIDDIGKYFDTKGRSYDDIIERLYSGKHKDLATLEELDKTCILKGFRAFTYPVSKLVSVYFDGKQIDLLDYAVEDVVELYEGEETLRIAGLKATQFMPMMPYISEYVDRGDRNYTFSDFYRELDESLQDGVDREAMLANALYQGMLSMEKGKIKKIRVIEVCGGRFTVYMIDHDGKYLVKDDSDEDYVFQWTED